MPFTVHMVTKERIGDMPLIEAAIWGKTDYLSWKYALQYNRLTTKVFREMPLIKAAIWSKS